MICITDLYNSKTLKKNCFQIYLYDLDETYQIPLKHLNVLKKYLAEEKCAILHCSMNNLIPLGVSDGKWPKFSCDRLIEELKKYHDVYFSKCVCHMYITYHITYHIVYYEPIADSVKNDVGNHSFPFMFKK